jgi:hypothetical protein
VVGVLLIGTFDVEFDLLRAYRLKNGLTWCFDQDSLGLSVATAIWNRSTCRSYSSKPCKNGGEAYDAMTTSFYLGHESLTVRSGLNPGRRLLFTLLRKNELDATTRLGVPPNRVVEMGARLDLD